MVLKEEPPFKTQLDNNGLGCLTSWTPQTTAQVYSFSLGWTEDNPFVYWLTPGSDFGTHQVIKSELQDSTNETAAITKWIFAFYYCASPV